MTKCNAKSLSEYSLEEIKSRSRINENGCWERVHLPMVKLNGKEVKLARITLALANPAFDINNPKIYACHKCDNDRCVNPAHLFPGRSSENQKDHWGKVRAGKTSRLLRGGLRLGAAKIPRYIPVDDEK